MLSQIRTSRKGLTLMELVVVMTILAALATIAVAMFPNLLRRSHKVVDGTNSSEVAKIVQLHQAMYLDYPDQLDLMTVATGTTPPDFLPADGGVPFGGGAQIGNLTADEVSALGRVGIKTGHHFAATSPNHPTMDPYSGAISAPTTLTATTPVFIIDSSTTGEYPQEIKNIIARGNAITPTPVPARFVVFGFGARNTCVGSLVQTAPTNAPQNAELTPSTHYVRVGVIFQVSGDGISTPGGTKRARFIGSCALEDDELESTEKDLVGYYDVVKSKQ